jgi:type III restriction enzyme
MKLKFAADQEHQVAAVEAVAGLLHGQPPRPPQMRASQDGSFTVVPNEMELSWDDLLANLHRVQADRGIPLANALSFSGEGEEAYPNFSVEMETGTGKTYVYLRSALRLSASHGIRKFIVVVPSIAIREGVLKTLEVTQDHFAEVFGRLPYRFFAYDSSNLGRVRIFALSEATEFMVVTIAAFRAATTIFNQATDRMGSVRPVDMVAAVRPVLILDEPQNMETDLAQSALGSLRPLMALRFSATHRSRHPVVYHLTPREAYLRGLVKRIQVASIVERDNENTALVRLVAVQATAKSVKAKLAVRKAGTGGRVREAEVTVRDGDDLRAKTGLAEYQGYLVDQISAVERFVLFTNGVTVSQGMTAGVEREAVVEAQVRTTIEQHLLRQERLRPHGVKVLSLFFIDRVDSYAGADAPLKALFARVFDEVKGRFPSWRDKSADQVQAAYFASRARRNGTRVSIDTGGDTQLDGAAYELIMRDKERLLSFDEDVAFIFSHSALREGWDNPNIFQVCTLREVGSDAQRRQQVGRGVRLAVNQEGERVHGESLNVLTVVASESYQSFVAGLQAETAGTTPPGTAAPDPSNARDRQVVRVRPSAVEGEEFKELWKRISRRTRYSVAVDTARLVEDAGAALENIVVPAPRVVREIVAVNVGEAGDLTPIVESGARTLASLEGRFPLPDLLAVIEEMLEATTPPMRLTRRTLLDVLRRADRWDEAVRNPRAFATAAVAAIKEKLAAQLVAGITYEPLDEWYEMSLLGESFEEWADRLAPSVRPDGSPGAAIFEAVPCDSETVERAFVGVLEGRMDVKVYAKLPRTFTIDTPIGRYNPDWAIAMNDPEGDGTPKLYLVRETKGSLDAGNLRLSERMKIACGERHFRDALGVDYRGWKPGDGLP